MTHYLTSKTDASRVVCDSMSSGEMQCDVG